jgi:signal transduction histidine kinase
VEAVVAMDIRDDEALERLVVAEQIEALNEKAGIANVVSVINGVVLLIALNVFAPLTWRLFWLVAVSAVACLRWGLSRSYRRRPPKKGTAGVWGSLYTLGAGMNGVVWGLVPLIFPTRGDIIAHVLVCFVIGGLVAGATASASSYQPAYRAFTFLALSPLIVVLLAGGQRHEMAMGVMLILFAVGMSLLARSSALTFAQTTRLRVQNSELTDRLVQARDQLEQRVRDRTAALEATLEEQRRAEARAQDAVRARDQFLALASHELVTPLSVLQIHMRILEAEISRVDPAAADPLRRTLPTFARQILRLTGLVDTVFRVSGLDKGHLVLEPRDIDLAVLVKDAVADMEATGNMNPNRSTLSLELLQPLRGRWDPVRVEQIVINLVSNAFKYAAGTPIHISLGLDPAHDAQVLLTVSDRGPGIAPDEQRRIFDKFQRGSSVEPQPGLGLGLFVVRELTKAMGGTIALQSSPGAGTKFSVSLPKTQPDSLSSGDNDGHGVRG